MQGAGGVICLPYQAATKHRRGATGETGRRVAQLRDARRDARIGGYNMNQSRTHADSRQGQRRIFWLLGTTLILLAIALTLPAGAFAFSDATDGWAVGEAGSILAATNRDASTVVVGTSPDYPPYESLNRNGAIVGFDIDLVKAIGQRAGFAIELQSSGFGELSSPASKTLPSSTWWLPR